MKRQEGEACTWECAARQRTQNNVEGADPSTAIRAATPAARVQMRPAFTRPLAAQKSSSRACGSVAGSPARCACALSAQEEGRKRPVGAAAASRIGMVEESSRRRRRHAVVDSR